MPLPVTFATLPTGNNPASLLDTEFLAVANMGTTYCTATGTNTILLTVAPNQPTPTGYANGQQFSFIAPASNTGPVTIQVGSLAAIPLRAAGAALGAGALIAGTTCNVVVSGGGTTADVVGGSGAASGAYLPLTGGTLTGQLTIASTPNANLIISKPVGAFNNAIFGQVAGSTRWTILPGNNTAEAAGNVGSDFMISRYDNSGNYVDTPFTITRSSGAVAIKGSNTNDSAAAAYVGEYISSVVASGSALTLTSGTAVNVTNISVTAGDWDISGEVWFLFGTGGGTTATGAINTTSATFPSVPGSGSRNQIAATLTASNNLMLPLAPFRFSVAATTTVYLIAYATFPSGTTTAYGRIGARRIR